MKSIEFINKLGLVDLISEMHQQLRQQTMLRINERLSSGLSEMEVYMLSLVEHQALSVSEAARYMNISRQAAHKHVQRLVAQQWLTLTTSETNRRDKLITLTPQGHDVAEHIQAVKAEVEQELQKQTGAEQYRLLKENFQRYLAAE